jgi:hypothetical protein
MKRDLARRGQPTGRNIPTARLLRNKKAAEGKDCDAGAVNKRFGPDRVKIACFAALHCILPETIQAVLAGRCTVRQQNPFDFPN